MSWIYFLKRCSVDYLKFYALWYTYTTLRFDNNISVEIVSKLLWYESINISFNIYSCNEGVEIEGCGYFEFG